MNTKHIAPGMSPTGIGISVAWLISTRAPSPGSSVGHRTNKDNRQPPPRKRVTKHYGCRYGPDYCHSVCVALSRDATTDLQCQGAGCFPRSGVRCAEGLPSGHHQYNMVGTSPPHDGRHPTPHNTTGGRGARHGGLEVRPPHYQKTFVMGPKVGGPLFNRSRFSKTGVLHSCACYRSAYA
jgi:hypothetical protein